MGKNQILVRGIFVNVTTACNMACPDCFGHLSPFETRDMDFATCRAAIDLFFANRRIPKSPTDPESIIMFWGGEPLLNLPLIEKTLAWMKQERPQDKYGYRFAMVTNGLNLTEDVADYLFSQKVEVFISLDGPYDTYKIRRPVSQNAFDQIVGNIRSASKKNPADLLGVYSVLKEKDISQFASVIEYVRSLGIRKMAISKEEFELFWKDESKKKLYELVKNYKKNHPDMKFLFYPESTGGCTNCHPQYIMAYPDGSVYDICLTSGSVIKREGCEEAQNIDYLYFGKLGELKNLEFDVDRKRSIITKYMFCPTVQRDYQDEEIISLAI